MDVERLYQFIEKKATPELPDLDYLRNLIYDYPYFQEAVFIYLKALYRNEELDYQPELERMSITINDRRALFYYIFSEEYERLFTETGRKEIKEDKTNILLNAFFESKEDTFTDYNFEQNLSSSSLATIDYLSYLQMETSETETDKGESKGKHTELKHQDIIDSFITRSEMEGGIRLQMNDNIAELHETDMPEEETDSDTDLDEDVFFTETLAKIYIRQKKYEKAYKIIKHLSLNYPKKNIYFADQLSFLEKLIINSKHKDKK